MARIEARRIRCVQKPFDIHHLARVVHEVAAAGAAPGRGARPNGARPAP
jgi:hypothetical protein